MIHVAETPADFAACAAIFADVEPKDRVTADELATAGGRYLLCGHDGYAYVKRSSVPASADAIYSLRAHEGRLENGLTAVKRSHRRRGIASALKQAQVASAAEHGYREIVSTMVEGNDGMRAVNARLGYGELPAWIVVEGPA